MPNNFGMDTITCECDVSTIGNDPVNHPSHYTDGKIEVIDFILDKKLGFCLGNVVKYVSRAGKKDKSREVQDLEKAEFYLKKRIDELKNDRELMR